MAFIESQLLTRVSYGFTGGPTYLTTKVDLYSGYSARNAERSLPLYVYSAPYDAIETADHNTIIAAYNACKGRLHGFRFKDWADYDLAGEAIGTSVGGGAETMQLIKTYTFGGQSTVRNIVKPTGQVVLLQDGAALSSTTDTTTGIVTFTASAAGKAITVSSGEFDVPVMFGSDSLAFNFVNWAAHSTDIELIEDLSA